MPERRTLYTGMEPEDVLDPREGDLFVKNTGELMWYNSYRWCAVVPTATYDPAQEWLMSAHGILNQSDLYELKDLAVMAGAVDLQELVTFMKYLSELGDKSEVKRDYQLWKAQARLENANG